METSYKKLKGTEMKEGWNWLLNSGKYHYFRNGQSLCGRWGILSNGGIDENHPDDDYENCKTCMKILKREKHKKLKI